MTDRSPSVDLTLYLERLGASEESEDARRLDFVVAELGKLARAHLARERSDHSLAPSDLCQEAYLRLTRKGDASWPSRGHFFKMASMVIRCLLVDHARKKKAEKRGGEGARLSLGVLDGRPIAQADEVDTVSLDEALTRLEKTDPELARVVELRFFGGLEMADVADTLGLTLRTAERRWRVARAWLKKELS